MPYSVILTGFQGLRLIEHLRRSLRGLSPTVVGVASAFVSVSGIESLVQVFRQVDIGACRLAAGIDLGVTHPNALKIALNEGWEVRTGRSESGIFHPKIMVAGDDFMPDDTVSNLIFVYIGSGNFTTPGLNQNVECGVILKQASCRKSFSQAFATIWQNSQLLTDERLKIYSQNYSQKIRSKKPRDYISYGFSDEEEITQITSTNVRQKIPPRTPVVDYSYATVAWVGLESFTGEYTFQVEFPRIAGEVVFSMIGNNFVAPNDVNVMCSDGQVRTMRYLYYHHNSMFRINIPNDVEGVQWARNSRTGIALIQKRDDNNISISLSILHPGVETDEIIQRSYLTGAWRKTPTRAYGWY